MTYAFTQLEAEVVDSYALPLVATFGQNIKRLMEERSMSFESLRAALDVKQGTLSDWVRDRRGLPEGPTLIRFAKILHVQVEELITGVDPEYDAIRNDLLCQAPEIKRQPRQKEAADVPASARVRELQDRLAAYQTIIRHAHDLGVDLVAATAVGAEGRAVTRATTRRRGRDRKTGG